jgi:hypothetical protein
MSNIFYSAEGNLCNNKTNKSTEDNDLFNTTHASVNDSNDGSCKSPVSNPVYFTNYPKRDSAYNKHIDKNSFLINSNVVPVQKQQESQPQVQVQPQVPVSVPVQQQPQRPVQQRPMSRKNKGFFDEIVDTGSNLLSSVFGLFSSDEKSNMVENKTSSNGYSNNVQRVEKFTEDKPSRNYYSKALVGTDNTKTVSANSEYGMIQTTCNVVSKPLSNNSNKVTGYSVPTDFEQNPVNYEILPSNRNKVCESCNMKPCTTDLPVPYEFSIMSSDFRLGPNTCVKSPVD